MTLYGAATPSCPSDWGGTAPLPSLALLDVAHGYAFVVPPRIWSCGAPNAARQTSATGC
jgi:hypothetical protein